MKHDKVEYNPVVNITHALENWIATSLKEFLESDYGKKIAFWLENEATEEEVRNFHNYYYDYIGNVMDASKTVRDGMKEPSFFVPFYREEKMVEILRNKLIDSIVKK